MNIVGEIIGKLKKVEPNLNWIAFALKGGSDSFDDTSGFKAIELCIENYQIKNPTHSSDISFDKIPTVTKNYQVLFNRAEEITNYSELDLCDAIVPKGVSFFPHWGSRMISMNSGWSRISRELYKPCSCSGVLLIHCEPSKEFKNVKIIPKEQNDTYSFAIRKKFEGVLLILKNTEDQLGKEYPLNSLPIIFPGNYLEEIKKTVPEIIFFALKIELTDKGLSVFKLNEASICFNEKNNSQKNAKEKLKEILSKNKNLIIEELLSEESLRFQKGQEFKISGNVYFVDTLIIGSSSKPDDPDSESYLQKYLKIGERNSQIAFKYRLEEKFLKEVVP